MPAPYKVAAQLLLDTAGVEKGAAQAQGVIGRIKASIGSLARDTSAAGVAIRGMFADFAKAGAAAAAAYKSIGYLKKGLLEAQAAGAGDISLKISTAYVGDSPEALAEKMKGLRKLAFETSKDVTGTMGDVSAAFAQALNMGVSPKALRSGLGRAGALLADAEGMTKSAGLAMVNKLGGNFEMAPDQTGALADTLIKSRAVSGFETMEQFAHELSRGAPAIARVHGTPEQAALFLAAMSRIRTEGAGQSLDAFVRGLTDPGKAKDRQRYGFDRLFERKTGTLVGPEKMDAVFAAFRAKIKTPEKQTAALTEVFGSEGMLLADAFARGNMMQIQAERDAKLGLEARLKLKKAGLGYQKAAAGGTAQTGLAEAFRPAARWYAGAVEKANTAVISPVAAKVVESDRAQELISGAAIAVPASLALAAGAFGLRGALRGGKAVNELGGLRKIFGRLTGGADLAAGVAAGKMLEKTAGVAPVFVTNWPGQAERKLGGGLMTSLADEESARGGGASGAAGAAAGAATVSRRARLAALAGTAGVAAAGALAIYGVSRSIGGAHTARDLADAQAANRPDATTAIGAIAAARRARAAREGWSAEKTQAEIDAAITRAAAQRAEAPQEGAMAGYLGGWKQIIAGNFDTGIMEGLRSIGRAAADLVGAATGLNDAAGELRRAAELQGRGA